MISAIINHKQCDQMWSFLQQIIKKKQPKKEPSLTELIERNAKMEVGIFLIENGMQSQGVTMLEDAATKPKQRR